MSHFLLHALCKMLWLHQKLKQKGPNKRSENCLWLPTAPLPHHAVSWLSDLNLFWAFEHSLPPWKELETLPQISTLVIHETRDTNTFWQLAARCQRFYHEPCILYFQCAIKRILAFPASLRSLQKIQLLRRPVCLTWTPAGNASARGTLSAAGSWDEGGLLCRRSWISFGEQLLLRSLASSVCSSKRYCRLTALHSPWILIMSATNMQSSGENNWKEII